MSVPPGGSGIVQKLRHLYNETYNDPTGGCSGQPPVFWYEALRRAKNAAVYVVLELALSVGHFMNRENRGVP